MILALTWSSFAGLSRSFSWHACLNHQEHMKWQPYSFLTCRQNCSWHMRLFDAIMAALQLCHTSTCATCSWIQAE